MTSFDSLPEVLILKIVKMATDEGPYYLWGRKYNHDFLVDVLSKVSVQFKRVATDSSLWKGHVRIWMDGGRAWGKDRFVVEECVNSGTREIAMLGVGMEDAIIFFHTGLALGRRFPNQKWV